MRSFEILNDLFIRPSDYVDAKALTGTTAETFTVPATAQFVRLRGTGLFYFKHTDSAGTPTAAAPADTADGTASTLVTLESGGVYLKVSPTDKISVVAAADGVVTAEYWLD
jgi:hypothetical protein